MTTEDLCVYFKAGGGVFSKNLLKAVHKVSLRISEGELIEIVGQSGSGKTTLARTLVGLQKPTSGRIFYRGRNIVKLNRKERLRFRREVNYIHQDPYSALNPSRTVYDAIAPALLRWNVCSRKNVRDTVYELLSFVGLQPPELFVNKYPHQLSGGQRQRVVIASVLGLQPKLVVADEIISMLDVSLKLGIMDLVALAKQKFGSSFVFVTHDIAAGRYLEYKMGGGRMYVMYAGRIVETGAISEVLSHPLHPYTELLLQYASDETLERIQPERTDSPPLNAVGCPFANKCKYAMPLCRTTEPGLSATHDRLVACHLYTQRAESTVN